MSLYEEIWHHDNSVKANYIASSLSVPIIVIVVVIIDIIIIAIIIFTIIISTGPV